MALIACRECAHEISSEAPTCPRCGVPEPMPHPSTPPESTRARRSRIIAWSAVAVGALGVLVLMFSWPAPDPAKRAAELAAWPGPGAPCSNERINYLAKYNAEQMRVQFRECLGQLQQQGYGKK